jgi:hypothetical protein
MSEKQTNNSMIFKAVVIILALILAYLFALNGRYLSFGNAPILDKWTRTFVVYDAVDGHLKQLGRE